MIYTKEQMEENFKQISSTSFQWGDWFIMRLHNGWHLMVSSGIAYGPFQTYDETLQHAAGVAI